MIKSLARKCLMVDYIQEGSKAIYDSENGPLACNCNKYYYPGNNIGAAIKYFTDMEDKNFINMLYMNCDKDNFLNIEKINQIYGKSDFNQISNISMRIIEDYDLAVSNVIMNSKTYNNYIKHCVSISEENPKIEINNNLGFVFYSEINICEYVADNDIIYLAPGEFLGVVAIKKDINIEGDNISLENGMMLINNYAIAITNIENYENQKNKDISMVRMQEVKNLFNKFLYYFDIDQEFPDFSELKFLLLKHLTQKTHNGCHICGKHFSFHVEPFCLTNCKYCRTTIPCCKSCQEVDWVCDKCSNDIEENDMCVIDTIDLGDAGEIIFAMDMPKELDDSHDSSHNCDMQKNCRILADAAVEPIKIDNFTVDIEVINKYLENINKTIPDKMRAISINDHCLCCKCRNENRNEDLITLQCQKK